MRTLVLVIFGATFATGFALWLAGRPPGGALTAWGGLLFVAALFERWRYRPPAAAPDAAWQDTGERFIDPGSGREMAVWFDARSGQRRYEPTDGRPADDGD